MAVGKRRSTDERLTEHDVAERLHHSALRTLNILSETRQMGMRDAVKHSRYFPWGLLELLAKELEEWNEK